MLRRYGLVLCGVFSLLLRFFTLSILDQVLYMLKLLSKRTMARKMPVVLVKKQNPSLQRSQMYLRQGQLVLSQTEVILMSLMIQYDEDLLLIHTWASNLQCNRVW